MNSFHLPQTGPCVFPDSRLSLLVFIVLVSLRNVSDTLNNRRRLTSSHDCEVCLKAQRRTGGWPTASSSPPRRTSPTAHPAPNSCSRDIIARRHPPGHVQIHHHGHSTPTSHHLPVPYLPTQPTRQLCPSLTYPRKETTTHHPTCQCSSVKNPKSLRSKRLHRPKRKSTWFPICTAGTFIILP